MQSLLFSLLFLIINTWPCELFSLINDNDTGERCVGLIEVYCVAPGNTYTVNLCLVRACTGDRERQTEWQGCTWVHYWLHLTCHRGGIARPLCSLSFFLSARLLPLSDCTCSAMVVGALPFPGMFYILWLPDFFFSFVINIVFLMCMMEVHWNYFLVFGNSDQIFTALKKSEEIGLCWQAAGRGGESRADLPHTRQASHSPLMLEEWPSAVPGAPALAHNYRRCGQGKPASCSPTAPATYLRLDTRSPQKISGQCQ